MKAIALVNVFLQFSVLAVVLFAQFILSGCTPEITYSAEDSVYEAARIHYVNEEYREAADQFYHFVHHFPGSSKVDDSWYFRGKSLLSVRDRSDRDLDEAITSFGMVGNSSPRWVDARYQTSLCRIGKGDIANAFAELTRIYEEYPHGPRAGDCAFALGNVYQIKQERDSALLWFQRCDSIPHSENRHKALYELGKEFASQNQWDSARFWWNRLLAEYPTSSKADNVCLKFGEFHWDTYSTALDDADFGKASVHLDTAILWYTKIRTDYKSSGSYSEALFKLGSFYYMNRFSPEKRDSAIVLFSEYCAINDSTTSRHTEAKMKLDELQMGGVGND